MDRLNQPPPASSSGQNRLDAILAQKEDELRQLKSELDLRDLYIEEMQAALTAQASELAALDERLRRLEPVRTGPRARRTLLPITIRIKNFKR